MSLTPFKFPFVAGELAIAALAGRYACAHLSEPVVAGAFFALAGLGTTCAWIILASDSPRKPRPPYGGVA